MYASLEIQTTTAALYRKSDVTCGQLDPIEDPAEVAVRRSKEISLQN